MIDVIIPTRNAPESLMMTLSYFCTHAPMELIASVTMIDNVSTSPGMDGIFSKAMSRGFSVIRNEKNVGVWVSVNRGLALSRSKYTLILTSDVLVGPGMIELLYRTMEVTGMFMLGPDVAIGIENEIKIHTIPPGDLQLNFQHYNGACWMMNRERLPEMGTFDHQFYICFGDVDYVERMRKRYTETQDLTLHPAVISQLYCCHLDKQSRRHDFTAAQDTDMELEDGKRFRAKWKDEGDVVHRHREIPHAAYVQFKERDLGGWKAARIR